MELDDSTWAKASHIDNRCSEERGIDVSILCASCKHGQVMRRKGKLHHIVWCDSAGMGNARDVPEDLAFCSAYEDKRRPSLNNMTDMAVPIDVRKGVDDKSYL